MLKRLSLRTKIIIFCIASLIGIGIIISEAIENRRTPEKLDESSAKFYKTLEAKKYFNI